MPSIHALNCPYPVCGFKDFGQFQQSAIPWNCFAVARTLHSGEHIVLMEDAVRNLLPHSVQVLYEGVRFIPTLYCVYSQHYYRESGPRILR